MVNQKVGFVERNDRLKQLFNFKAFFKKKRWKTKTQKDGNTRRPKGEFVIVMLRQFCFAKF